MCFDRTLSSPKAKAWAFALQKTFVDSIAVLRDKDWGLNSLSRRGRLHILTDQRVRLDRRGVQLNLNMFLGRMLLLLAMLGTCNICDAGFLIDGFNSPYGVSTNASTGQLTQTNDSLGNQRIVNVTALLNAHVDLTISGGNALYTVSPFGGTPSASLTLSYSDPIAANSLANYEAIVLSNVSSTNNWFLTVTMKGTGSPATSTYSPNAPSITAGFSGDLKIPLSQFSTSPSPFSMGPLSDIQFSSPRAAQGNSPWVR